jgi:hypothetical protein
MLEAQAKIKMAEMRRLQRLIILLEMHMDMFGIPRILKASESQKLFLTWAD